MDGKWLSQKLSQNGFSAEDLARQSGLDLSVIQNMIQDQDASKEDWDIVLGVMNQYPTLYYPTKDLIDLIDQQINTGSGQEQCIVYYGVNQDQLIFAGCRFDDGSLHGANVDPTMLRWLELTLEEARDLFFAQASANENGLMESRQQ